MAETDTRSIKVLFREWRQGDAEAGQIMAQRFADWYYAIATSRLGEDTGREPCETACRKFGEGVASVSESRALVAWAHKIIQEELSDKGDRVTDGDDANAYTGNQRPKTLLARARQALPSEVGLLERCYRHGTEENIEPLPVLKARYKVKQWLRDNQGVPFDVAPDEPVLDRAPMPLYESGRMATPAEEVNFEQWMISDLDLCKDIAEFAHFAIALRGGLPESLSETPAPVPNVPRFDDDDHQLDTGTSSTGTAAKVAGGMGLVAILGGGALLVVVLLIAAYFLFM
ncbi:MAG: hypothetical protein R3F61_26655 [Myxococcota bacterium]